MSTEKLASEDLAEWRQKTIKKVRVCVYSKSACRLNLIDKYFESSVIPIPVGFSETDVFYGRSMAAKMMSTLFPLLLFLFLPHLPLPCSLILPSLPLLSPPLPFLSPPPSLPFPSSPPSPPFPSPSSLYPLLSPPSFFPSPSPSPFHSSLLPLLPPLPPPPPLPSPPRTWR